MKIYIESISIQSYESLGQVMDILYIYTRKKKSMLWNFQHSVYINKIK